MISKNDLPPIDEKRFIDSLKNYKIRKKKKVKVGRLPWQEDAMRMQSERVSELYG